MNINVSVQDRSGNEIANFDFVPDAVPRVIELYDRTGRTISILDPLVDQINMILPIQDALLITPSSPEVETKPA